MEIRVLGEVGACLDGQPAGLGHQRQRCVLAVLAAEAGRVVAVDQLIDRVWGDRAPDGVRNTLYSYLTRLRQALDSGGDAMIVRRPGGYVLAVDPSAVDLHRFRDLLASARTADDTDADALFSQALGLWRGEAFAGLDTPWLDSVRSEAEEERWAAELDYADLRLRRGEHVQLLPALSARAEQDPLDERLAGQLMLAFYRSGRQADALAAFREIRARLAEELGVDPGPELRETHERILRGECGLAPAAPAAPGSGRPGALTLDPPHRESPAPRPEPSASFEPLDRAARELATAVDRQWSAEAEIRSLRQPEPVRLRWSSTARPVSAAESAIVHGTGGAGQPGRLRLRGDLSGLAGAFRELPARQLVILGQPGAGKTVLAMLLTLELLHAPGSGEPVPVLLSLSSWNPEDEHLHSWIARKLAEEHPGLANTRSYGPGAAARLVAGGRVLPVLDGLDEMPPGLHAAAVDALDRAVAGGRPLVVTCRGGEYERAVRRGGSLLARAAVVEIEPVTPGDAAAFLTGRERTGDTRWQPVARHLADHPGGVLARALSTPLMVDLARSAYSGPGTSPADLCDTARFRGPAEIEDHLLGSFLPSAYAGHPPAPGSERAEWPRYQPERARCWLAFLAGHMMLDQRTHDFAWWQLADALSRPARSLLFGLPPALPFAVAGALVGGPLTSLVYGLSFAVAGCAVAWLSSTPEPRRAEIRFHGTTGRFARRFATGVAIAIGLGLGWAMPFGWIALLAMVFGSAIGVHAWLDTPADARRASSPSVALGQDRVSTQALVVATALSLGLFFALAFETPRAAASAALPYTFDLRPSVPAGAAAALLGWFAFGRPGLAYGLAGAVIGGEATYWIVSLPVSLAAGAVFALAVGLTLVASRAWGAYLLTRLCLAARGRLPLRLMRFLDDAHRRGVLRNAGAVYQFRHARLADRLSSQE